MAYMLGFTNLLVMSFQLICELDKGFDYRKIISSKIIDRTNFTVQSALLTFSPLRS